MNNNKKYNDLYVKCSQKIDVEEWGKRFFESVFDDIYYFVEYVQKIEKKFFDEYGEKLYDKKIWFEKYVVLFEFEKYDDENVKYYKMIFDMVYDEIVMMG